MDGAQWVVELLLGLSIVGWAVRIGALIVVPVNRRPGSATAWLMLIFLAPYIGGALYLLIGNPKLPKVRREKQRLANARILELTAGMDNVPDDDPGPPWLASVVRLNRQLGAMPLVTGNHVRLVDDYDGAIHEMADAIDAATDYVHVEVYILAFDDVTRPFFAALERAAERGVSVRVLWDHIGSRGVPAYKNTRRELARLAAVGVESHLMLPVLPLRRQFQRPDLRNHRKLIVIDGHIAFVGSQNVIDRTYGKRKNQRRGLKWQELVARVEGPVVGGVNALFVTDWFSETDQILEGEIERGDAHLATSSLECQVVPSGPGFEGENNLKLFNSLLYSATERVSITSPYFVPDASLLTAVCTAAERGVAVELFVSAVGDQWMVYHAQRSYYEVLLRAGVRIYRYPAPYILHAKHLSIDDSVAVIGSSNLDMRSFELNLESTLLVHGTDFVDQLRAIEDGYREISAELTLAEHMARPLPGRVVDNITRLTSALQ